MNKLFNLGVEHAQTISEQKRIRLLNQLVFVCLFVCSIELINELFKKDYTGFLFDLIVVSPITLCFFLNKKGWYLLAKRVFIIFAIVLLTSALIFYGRGSGAEYAYLVVVTFTFIFFIEKREIILFNVLIAFCLLSAQVYFLYFEPLYGVIHIPNLPLIGSLICQIFIVFAFVEENKKFDKNTQELLAKLSNKNMALDGQKKLTDKKNEALLKANRELERFAYATSHDLRSPLRNIVSFIELYVETEEQHISETGKQYLDFVQSNARHMDQLIENILTHTSLHAQEVIEPIDLNKIVRQLSIDFKGLLGQHIKIESANLPTINADPIKMRLLFQNIIENGLRYNASELPSVSISLERNDGAFVIMIRDNGIGIAPKYHQQIFLIFKRLHGQDEYKGTGVGLATCSKIVEAYNGRIEIESTKEAGSVFKIYFPESIEAISRHRLDKEGL